jgi:hypothetical protein
LVRLDVFYIGKLTRMGKIWHVTACDAACVRDRHGGAAGDGADRCALPAPTSPRSTNGLATASELC